MSALEHEPKFQSSTAANTEQLHRTSHLFLWHLGILNLDVLANLFTDTPSRSGPTGKCESCSNVFGHRLRYNTNCSQNSVISEPSFCDQERVGWIWFKTSSELLQIQHVVKNFRTQILKGTIFCALVPPSGSAA